MDNEHINTAISGKGIAYIEGETVSGLSHDVKTCASVREITEL